MKIDWFKQHGIFWIWLGSWTFYVKDSRKISPLFSERKRINCTWIGPYIVSLKKRGT